MGFSDQVPVEIDWKQCRASCYHIGCVDIRDYLFLGQTILPLHNEVLVQFVCQIRLRLVVVIYWNDLCLSLA